MSVPTMEWKVILTEELGWLEPGFILARVKNENGRKFTLKK